jgi:hypothetical protein
MASRLPQLLTAGYFFGNSGIRKEWCAMEGRTSQASPWPLVAGLGPLGALPTAPRLARTFTVVVLGGWRLAELAEDAELVASELCSNVVRAASGPDGQPRYDGDGRLPLLWLRLLSDGAQLRIEAWDTVAAELGVPAPRRRR